MIEHDYSLLEAAELEQAYRSLSGYFKYIWEEIEPGTPLLWNWHLDILSDALQKQIEGDPEYRKLGICIPPGTCKSIAVSVVAPTWEWLHVPTRRKLALSNDRDLSSRDSRRARELIQSDKYKRLRAYAVKRGAPDWVDQDYEAEPWELTDDQNEKVNFQNTAKGFRQSRSIFAKLTGKRAHDILIDDPLDASEVTNGTTEQVAKRLQTLHNVLDKTLPSRVNNLAEARWTLIMQRLHENDPAGRVIKEGDWKIVNLQMEYDPKNPLNHPDDPRTEDGELLFPELFSRVEIEKLKIKLGNDYYAQYQQDPKPGDRAVLKREYWRFWYPRGMRVIPDPVVVQKEDGTLHTCVQVALPVELGSLTQSWDMTFKDLQTSAYVVGQVWAAHGPDSFLLDQVRDKWDIVATIQQVLMLSSKWPTSIEKLIEDKANGTAVMRILRSKLVGITEVEPDGGKPARVNAAAPVVRSGNVYLPHPALNPWVEDLLREAEYAPFGTYMDQVDTLTQYINHRFGGDSAALDALLGL